MKKLKQIDFAGKRVIIRAGMNVPVKNGQVVDDVRIKSVLPTIKYAVDQSPKFILLVTHLGRPGGKVVAELSTKPLIEPLKKMLKRKIVMIDSPAELEELINADSDDKNTIYLLENIRFWPEERANDQKLAEELSKFFDVYVNEAFSTAHREHLSIVGLPKYTKEKCAGMLFEEELDKLTKIKDQPEHPAVAVIGGAKIATKLPVIENLARDYDKVLMGGMVANETIDQKLELGDNVMLPTDFSPEEKKEERLDIGPETVAAFTSEIKKAQTIVWNGPMGKFEDDEAAEGTQEIMKAIAENHEAMQVIGGGETLEALRKFGDFSDFDYVSMSGGAMLEFLAGKELPGVRALED